jgi:hypothetical protein
VEPLGYDEEGRRVWIHRPGPDFREEMLRSLYK